MSRERVAGIINSVSFSGLEGGGEENPAFMSYYNEFKQIRKEKFILYGE